MPHTSLAQLRQQLTQARELVSVGAEYVHYKDVSQRYCVVDLVILEATEEIAVVYRPLTDDTVAFVRPLASWQESLRWHGHTVARFTKG